MTPATLSSLQKNSLPQTGFLQPIQFEKGVGPQKADLLAKVGIKTVEDILFYFPRDHQDRRVVPIREAVAGKKYSFLADVVSIDFPRAGRMLGAARAQVRDGSAVIEAVWFKRLSFKYDVFAAIKRDVTPGKKVLLYGQVDRGENGAQLKVEDHEIVDETQPPQLNRIVPVYPLTEGLTDRWLRSLANRVIPQYTHLIPEPLPGALVAQQKLIPFNQAVRMYHFPQSWTERDRARERLAFDEFFLLELLLALSRQDREHHTKGFSFSPTKTLLTPFKNQLGYEFTRAQARTINEIFKDMARPFPMNRLLQGDVGSGKTVVALSAALLAIENKAQAAFLAPTEILAGQHAISMSRFLAKLPVRSALLTGSTPPAERKKILADLKEGKIDLLVGTHAILSEEVKFRHLGLAIIDEQHRFGVRQRAALVHKTQESVAVKQKGLLEQTHPDILIMTATPIPRTLALTLYGDLDISVIDELPAGRTPIHTVCAGERTALERVRLAIQKGRQAYVVFPIIEESEKLAKRGATVRAATKEFEGLQKKFPDVKMGLLHGAMKSEEKKKIMDLFRRGDLAILVATPVIEVGIDVPNATVMVISNPERFGMAALHQLRGRVGRGEHASECVLMVNEAPDENHRLSVFCRLTDGFRLAEEDLRMRGPGEFVGEQQHGVPFFRVGDLLRDGLLISQAREAARTLVEGDLPLTMKEFGQLNRTLQKRFGNKLQLTRVG